MRVAGDQRFVVRKRHSWNIFEQVVTGVYQISLETNCAEVLRKQLTVLDMVLNTPLSNKLSTYYYNTEVVKIHMITEAVAQRCSVKEVFLEISQNSQENTCARVSFSKKNFDIGGLNKNIQQNFY